RIWMSQETGLDLRLPQVEHAEWLFQHLLVTVVSVAAPVDYQETTGALQAQQRVMPGATGIVDALVRRADEGADFRFVQLARRGDDDQHARAVHRVERLAAQRMAFEHADFDGRLPGFALEQVDQRARGLAGEFHLRQVVVTGSGAGVDREGRGARRFDHVPEGREDLAGQRFDAQRLGRHGVHRFTEPIKLRSSSVRGAANSSLGSPISWTLPWCMKTSLSPTSRARRISWVTMIRVMPS